MKHSAENSRRWFEQAEYDFGQAEQLLANKVFSYAAFFAEQSAQKALKAFLLSKKNRYIMIHSVGELAEQAARLNKKFEPLIDSAKRLDRHYLSSRYPDALPEPAIPAKSYTRGEAKEAVETARRIIKLSKSVIQ